jgi:hypothetical protein
MIIASDGHDDYEQWLCEVFENFQKNSIQGIAVVALTKEGSALTGYWNMSLKDKIQVEAEIRFDTIDQFILANPDRYGIPEEEENGT